MLRVVLKIRQKKVKKASFELVLLGWSGGVELIRFILLRSIHFINFRLYYSRSRSRLRCLFLRRVISVNLVISRCDLVAIAG